MKAVKIRDLRFDTSNLRALPLDPTPFDVSEVGGGNSSSSRPVKNAIFAKTALQALKAPKVVAWSVDALALIGVDSSLYKREVDFLADIETYFSGNETIPGSNCEPYAHCYCGYQFGGFSGQLGDGAAMYLGEVVGSNQDDKDPVQTTVPRVDLQLKGSGKTPFSRSSDGRKVLRSSIREFLGSEALHFLGIPTTRAATCVTSSSVVQRDPFYDGRVQDEACTVITRIAPTFYRFGSFEVFKNKEGMSVYDREGPSAGNAVLRKKLLDQVVTYFPVEITSIADEKLRYEEYLRETVRRTVSLVVKWNTCGFVHGVLNTDNMSVVGLTIDYGPYAFLDHYDADFTPNGSDGSGRYTYEKQAQMMKWNLFKLAEALEHEIVSGKQIVEETFDSFYKDEYNRTMRAKMGLYTENSADENLFETFFSTLQACNTDFTDSFEALNLFHETLAEAPAGSIDSSMSVGADLLVDRLTERSVAPSTMIAACKRKMKIHKLTMHPNQIQGLWDMLQSQPDAVREMFGGAPLEAVHDEIAGEKHKLDRLIACSAEIKQLEGTNATAKRAADRARWEVWVSKYLERIGLDNLEHTTTQIEAVALQRRVNLMRSHNPAFILRNWIAQDAISASEAGDHERVRTILKMLETPFDARFSTFGNKTSTTLSKDEERYCKTSPSWAGGLLCTCSS